jgi:general secretion pathway protein D
MIEIARDLDRRAASGTEIRVIFLQHADADQLLPVLQQLMGQSVSAPAPARAQPTSRGRTTSMGRNGTTTTTSTDAPAPPPVAASASAGSGQGVFGNKSVVVTRFEGANALVIAAPTDVQRQLGEVIRQLDQRRPQVLVEAIIVEISDTAARELGVQLLLAGTKGSNIPFAVTNYSNAAPNIATIAGAVAAEQLRTETTTVNGQVVTTTRSSPIADALQEAAAQEILGSRGGLFGLGFRAGNAIFGAIVNAVQRDNKSNLLATPSVTVIDNQPAHFLAGQEVPVTTGEALSNNFDNAFRTVQRQNVGITLDVTPQINAGDTVKLDIRQEVSSVAGTVGGRNSADLILNKREIETSIIVDDGEIIGIGGLLNDNERRTIEKIPFLGDLPVVGNLFKSRGRQREKTNLMVFIRPTILRSRADAQAMTDRRYGYVRAQQYQQDPYREPTLDELVREYMGMEPPPPPPSVPAPLDPRALVPVQELGKDAPPLDPALYLPSVRPGDQVIAPTPVPQSQAPR